ncbi:MAG: HAD family hydrolase [Enterococcus sp.]
MKGIIFDFNGTMFQDSHFHEEAWIHMIRRYSDRQLTDDEILKQIHGRTNDEILRYFISSDLTNEEIARLSYEKEAYYRSLCQQHPEQLVLTKGLEETLDLLKYQAVPFTIATATVKENVVFYFDVFHLARWFDLNQVVFDDGSFPGKPQPDIFIKTAAKLHLKPQDCLVIEDAYSGLLAARRAEIGRIIAIDPQGKNQSLFEAKEIRKDALIQDFTNFYTNCFAIASM